MGKCILADVLYGAVGDAVVAYRHDPLRQRSEADDDGHADQNAQQSVEIHRACANQQIHCVAGEYRQIQCERHGNQRKQHGEQNVKNFVWKHLQTL